MEKEEFEFIKVPKKQFRKLDLPCSKTKNMQKKEQNPKKSSLGLYPNLNKKLVDDKRRTLFKLIVQEQLRSHSADVAPQANDKYLINPRKDSVNVDNNSPFPSKKSTFYKEEIKEVKKDLLGNEESEKYDEEEEGIMIPKRSHKARDLSHDVKSFFKKYMMNFDQFPDIIN